MGLFTPWFFAAIAGVALPLYLHLLRRHKSPPRLFPSLMLWESRSVSSTRHRRLDHLLLLALRLAVLVLLILAFAAPFIRRDAAAIASNRVMLIVIDNSFSMRAGTRLNDAKDAAMSVLSSKGAARAQVAAFGSRLQLLTQPIEDQAALRAAVQSLEPGDAHGNFAELARAVRSMEDSLRVPIEMHLFSDMQRSEVGGNFSDLALPSGVTLVTHPVGRKAVNWTVESVEAPGQVWGRDAKPIRVSAVIAGYGTPAARRTAALAVNGKTVASKSVDVPANGRAAVEFASVDVPYGFSKCEVRIDPPDAFEGDDVRRFAIERSDPQKMLLVHNFNDSRSPIYIGAAMSAAAQTAFIVESVSSNEAADRKLSNYAFVILSDVNTVPQLLENSLLAYVRGGGSVFIAAGTSAGSRLQVPIFGAKINASHSYTTLPEHSMGVGSTDQSYPPIAKSAGLAGVKVFYALDVDATDARVIARLGDQTPLLLEKKIGEGRVVLFTSGLDNLTNDLPLDPSFVPFIEQMARTLAGSERRGGSRTVDSFLELRSAQASQSQGVQVTDPQGRAALTLAEAASAQSFQLTQAGYYQIRFANGAQDEIGVNADPKESNLDVIPDDLLAMWKGEAPEQSQTSSSPSRTAPSKVPEPLWWYVMLAALLCAIAESVVASGYLGTERDDQPPVVARGS